MFLLLPSLGDHALPPLKPSRHSRDLLVSLTFFLPTALRPHVFFKHDRPILAWPSLETAQRPSVFMRKTPPFSFSPGFFLDPSSIHILELWCRRDPLSFPGPSSWRLLLRHAVCGKCRPGVDLSASRFLPQPHMHPVPYFFPLLLRTA